MPCLDIKINVKADIYEKEGPNFINNITKDLAKILNKPTGYIMISLMRGFVAMDGNVNIPTAFCNLTYLGPLCDNKNDLLKINENVSKSVAIHLKKHFNVDKYYLIIKEEERIGWGFNGGIPFYSKPKSNDNDDK